MPWPRSCPTTEETAREHPPYGHVPSGLRVFSVEKLQDSVDVLDAIADGGDLDALPTCTAADVSRDAP